MSATDDTPPTPTSRQGGRRWKISLFKIMRNHPELLCFAAAIVFSVCSNLCQSGATLRPPVQRPAPTPVHFFPATSVSHVEDYPLGDLEEVGDLLAREGVLVVMFYAPWCAQSRRVKAQFMLAAKYFSSQIKFVGINCWYPHGLCRKTNHFLAFPVIYFYHRNIDGFKYSGPLRAENIIVFIEQLMYPLTHITGHESLSLFLAQNERATVAYYDLNASPLPSDFYQFFYASLRTIEKDPLKRIAFGIVTAESVAHNLLHVSHGQLILIQYLNDTLTYPATSNFTSTAILQWLNKNARMPSASVSLPSGVKSLQLSNIVSSGPTLILFLPYYPLSGLLQPHTMLRELAVQYHGCGNVSAWRLDAALRGLDYGRTVAMGTRLDTLQDCASIRRSDKQQLKRLAKEETDDDDVNVDDDVAHEFHQNFHHRRPRNCCVSVSSSSTSSSSSPGCDLCLTMQSPHAWYHRETCPIISTANLSLPAWTEGRTTRHHCHLVQPTYHPDEALSLCCPPSPRSRHSQRRRRTDPYLQARRRQACHKASQARTHHWLPGLIFEETGSVTAALQGMGCTAGNRSLRFVSMDSRSSGMFMHRLGINSTAAAAVIVDIKDEEQYVLHGELTKQSLVEMISNYSARTLDTFHRSQLHSPPPPPPPREQCPESAVCVVDVTAHTFQHIVMAEGTDVVLLYYTPYCGFCTTFAHTYLALARYFRHSQNIVFARINAELNDLPWQYRVEAYPSIIFFPAHRKSESVAFPDKSKLRVPSLVRFVLASAAPELRLEIAVAAGSCSRACVRANAVAAARTARELQEERLLVAKRLEKTELLGEVFAGNEWWDAYRKHLREQERRLRLSEQSARQLHDALLRADAAAAAAASTDGSKGLHLEKHVLAAIQHRQRTL